jgi:8-oxo-dGTP pyrophosphatase MutT (NUDIX family)
MIELNPIRIPGSQKTELRMQFGALCYRIRNGKVQVLLVTGRRSGKWICPKGWPVNKATPAESALREAYEEAGVDGRVSGDCLGIFAHYPVARRSKLPTIVALFPVEVRKLGDDFPEKGQRKRKWFSRKQAAKRVLSPELAQMVLHFDPGHRPAKSQ